MGIRDRHHQATIAIRSDRPMEMDWRAIMACQRGLQLKSLCLLGVLAAGCCPPATFYVETTINADGSCDRMIWQPKQKFLPDEALKPDWNARWKTVSDASGRPGVSDSKPSHGECHYFIARGSFSSPREIPQHYRYTEENAPDAGASVLERSYERTDYGFLVEHRWQEKITNIVTLAGFLKARDELLDFYLPSCIDAIERVFGKDYDVSRLVSHLRVDGRRFLENVSVILYDAAAHHRVAGEDGVLDAALTEHLFAEAERFGLDRNLLVGVFSPPEQDEANARSIDAFLGRLVVQYFRHRDGTAVTQAEADALIQAIRKERRYQSAIKQEEKRLEEVFQKDKELEKRVKRAVFRMIGLYSTFGFLFSGGPPEYEFKILLPGELIETNGAGTKSGRTRWKFTGAQLFPDGYEMKARSIFIDRDGQRKVLGRVVTDDETTAKEFMELAGGEGPLLEAVRKLRQTGDREAFRQVKTRTFAESLRARKLRKLLFDE